MCRAGEVGRVPLGTEYWLFYLLCDFPLCKLFSFSLAPFCHRRTAHSPFAPLQLRLLPFVSFRVSFYSLGWPQTPNPQPPKCQSSRCVSVCPGLVVKIKCSYAQIINTVYWTLIRTFPATNKLSTFLELSSGQRKEYIFLGLPFGEKCWKYI